MKPVCCHYDKKLPPHCLTDDQMTRADNIAVDVGIPVDQVMSSAASLSVYWLRE